MRAASRHQQFEQFPFPILGYVRSVEGRIAGGLARRTEQVSVKGARKIVVRREPPVHSRKPILERWKPFGAQRVLTAELMAYSVYTNNSCHVLDALFATSRSGP
jgi:hypothetical protein